MKKAMTNEELNRLWNERGTPNSPVRNPKDGDGMDSDFMTIDFLNRGHQVYERKPGTTVWVPVS